MPKSEQRITVYGRKPVLEALMNDECHVMRVFVSLEAKGETVDQILSCAHDRKIEVRRMRAEQVTRISKHGRQDQGVAADIEMSGVMSPSSYLERCVGPTCHLVALDGITTQENAGMIIRSAVAAGMDGVLMADKGSAKIDPQVIKASAGTAFRTNIIQSERLEDSLASFKHAGFDVVGLDGDAKESLFDTQFKSRTILVIGNESIGICPETRPLLNRSLRIPMANSAESLNAACAATLACFAVSKK